MLDTYRRGQVPDKVPQIQNRMDPLDQIGGKNSAWGALILAGGKSQRMKENKALMALSNKPLLSYVVGKVLGLTYEIVVVIGRNDDPREYSALLPSKVTVLKDRVEGMGPLAGMLTGMQSMHSSYALVLPCDSPFIKTEVLKYLLDMAGGADAVIPRWPSGNIEPLHAVYRVPSAIGAAELALKRRELLILDMIKLLDKVVYVDTEEIRKLDEDLTTFFNVNSREDFRTAEMLLSRM